MHFNYNSAFDLKLHCLVFEKFSFDELDVLSKILERPSEDYFDHGVLPFCLHVSDMFYQAGAFSKAFDFANMAIDMSKSVSSVNYLKIIVILMTKVTLEGPGKYVSESLQQCSRMCYV